MNTGRGSTKRWGEQLSLTQGLQLLRVN